MQVTRERTMLASWKEALFSAETGYGRLAGWYFVCDGSVVGELTYIRTPDMFWDQYRLVCSDTEWQRRCASNEFWHKEMFEHSCCFRSKGIDREVRGVLVNHVPGSDRHVSVRFLYLRTPWFLVLIASLIVPIRRAFKPSSS